MCVPVSRNSEKDLTRKVISVFESSLSAHENPSYYVNTLLAPCRRSNIRLLIDRLNALSSQPNGAADNKAID